MGILLKARLAKKAVRAAGKAVAAAGAVKKFSHFKRGVRRRLHPKKEDVITMKKSTFAAIMVFLSAAVGALVAAYMYIQRREKELDEYEQLLFSEEFNQKVPEEGEEEADIVPAPIVEPEPEQEAGEPAEKTEE